MKLLGASSLILLSLACSSSTRSASQPSPGTATIDRADVVAAQTAWCDALVSIAAAAKQSPEAARTQAENVLNSAYNYDGAGVLFKPTLTTGQQTFRFDKAGALAYFVGGDPAYPDDHGFALKPWTSCEPELGSVLVRNDITVAMGKVHLVDETGKKATVDKTCGYVRDDKGGLRIAIHHSSLEYKP